MLNPDSLVERSKLKSQISFWRLICFLIVISIVMITFFINNKIDDIAAIEKPYVARIYIDSVIYEDQDRIDILNDIANDDKVKAVIMRINSPGGTAVGGEELYETLKSLSKKKPLVAVMDSLAASAAYLISLSAERSYAQNGTITGSIGVIMEIPNVKEAADKLGIKFDYIKTSPLKGSPTIFEPKNEQAFQVLDTMMRDFYHYFVKLVSEERKIPLDEAYKLADGRVFSGKAATENKLVDDIGGEKKAYDWLVQNKNLPNDIEVKEVKLYKPKKPFEEFLGSLSQNLGLKGLVDKIFNFKGLML